MEQTEMEKAWEEFSDKVVDHITGYVVEQYGDQPNDLYSASTPEELIVVIEKYCKRFRNNQRPDEVKRDMLKIAHLAQRIHAKL